MEVQNFFDCHIPVGKLDECTVVDKCGTMLSIYISNQYFTPRQESPDEALVKLTMDIDPSGYLEVLAGNQFFYGEQNVVKYYNELWMEEQ